MSIVYWCDKCSIEYPNDFSISSIQIPYFTDRGYKMTVTLTKDLCHQCWKLVRHYINNESEQSLTKSTNIVSEDDDDIPF